MWAIHASLRTASETCCELCIGVGHKQQGTHRQAALSFQDARAVN
eukprot:CAMPEP_0183410192 /NCGR_PEP_ID=MMETSP0370-20130417/19410_1 /TAXON_ID=268820 /ORGANISM="Peridinium aciculiferum, Strain PAER-2" /LENGTH=44 /DNA_ID= /DNA_START= /DNA_END= /DNA_ORIENTATION=